MAENLTYLEIAYKMLGEKSGLKQMHYRDLANRAFELGLIESDDLIVAGNIASSINADIKKAKAQGTQSRFISFGMGLYGLLEHEPKGIFADIRNKNQEVKKQLLEALHAMHPSKFEELVGEVLRNLGFENVQITGKTGDGGIDVTGELIVADIILEKVTILDLDKNEINFDFPELTETDGKEIEIFANYKDRKYFAIYFSPTKIIYENEVYNSPSGAGMKVQNGLPVN